MDGAAAVTIGAIAMAVSAGMDGVHLGRAIATMVAVITTSLTTMCAHLIITMLPVESACWKAEGLIVAE